jgi:hypothetical protein
MEKLLKREKGYKGYMGLAGPMSYGIKVRKKGYKGYMGVGGPRTYESTIDRFPKKVT